MDITELLAFSVKNNASDLHLSAGLPPIIRVDGEMRRLNVDPLDHKQVHALVYEIMNDKQRKEYEENLETDFSFEVKDLSRFRVNAFVQNRGAAAVLRTIPSKVLTLDDLGAPAIFKEIINQPTGIVLVTGATGNVLFAVLGLVFSLPLLRRLYRRFGSWKAPALALGVFALMFSFSAFVIGPAISNDDPSRDRDRTPVQTPDPDEHEGHHD